MLIFPFIMLGKNDAAKDYIVFLGMIGGAAAIFFPTGAWGYPPFRLESIRFYLSHILLFMQAFYTLIYKVHVPSYKRFWRVPISFFIVLGVIALNELVLRAAGFTEQTLEDMIADPTQRNSVYIFGLTPELESKLGFITALVSDFMKHGIGYRTGDYYRPWVWMFFPVMIYGEILAHAIGFIWGWKELKEDLKKKGYNGKHGRTVFFAHRPRK